MTDSIEEEAFNKVCGFLSHRQRTEQEIIRYLKKRGFDDVRVPVLERLKRAGLVNDLIFAETWVSERTGERGFGLRRLRIELVRLGVSAPVIEQALETSYPRDKETKRVLTIADRQWPKTNGKNSFERGKKLYEFLIRRGFDEQTSKEAVKAVLESEGITS